jgi:hypothetical protein
MHKFHLAFAAVVAAVGFMATTPKADAQVSINIGAAPACPYGYYDYAPYACAPYGYYGAEWFAGGVFIGAGPWFHGPAGFHGHVDNRFDINHGYRGPLPNRGDPAARRVDQNDHFRGNEMRDGHGGGRR